jgi:hypothetical protein
VCKIVAKEFVTLLKESEGKSEVLETGYSVQVGQNSGSGFLAVAWQS